MSEEKLLTYDEVLKKISNEECHLLLGNGFNNSLGINTSYKGIFNEMKKANPEYLGLDTFMARNDHNIEMLIAELKKPINKNDPMYAFLCKFIETKIKLDFMKACYSIVKDEIKNIYQDKNEDIYLLFKNFTNYFSLNYDPFLYLLLMRFKAADKKDVGVSFQNTSLFKEHDLNTNQNNIYDAIEEARRNGRIETIVNPTNTSEKALIDMPKKEFEMIVKEHFKGRGWKSADIKKVCDYIWEKEQGNAKLTNINDGFLFSEYNPNKTPQNIFFLHGAFHIYIDGKHKVYKITQEQDNALYNKLEEIINSEEKEILCILTNASKDKENSIKDNIYSKNCFDKIRQLNGSLMIFGSSLAENDKHIFNQVKESKISKIYISTSTKDYTRDYKRSKDYFPNKELNFFDYTTVSYKARHEGLK